MRPSRWQGRSDAAASQGHGAAAVPKTPQPPYSRHTAFTQQHFYTLLYPSGLSLPPGLLQGPPVRTCRMCAHAPPVLAHTCLVKRAPCIMG